MTLPIGTRVRVKSLNHTLRDAGAPEPLEGVVWGHDVLDYCLVRLDREVEHRVRPGVVEAIGGIRERAVNLEVLPDAERKA